MKTRKKILISLTMIVVLFATTAITPALSGNPDPQGGGPWPKFTCFLTCWKDTDCTYSVWYLDSDGTFDERGFTTGGTWSKIGNSFTLEYTWPPGADAQYSGTIVGRAAAGTVYDPSSTDRGAMSAVLNHPWSCASLPTSPEDAENPFALSPASFD